jgi:hypothetical protein
MRRRESTIMMTTTELAKNAPSHQYSATVKRVSRIWKRETKASLQRRDNDQKGVIRVTLSLFPFRLHIWNPLIALHLPPSIPTLTISLDSISQLSNLFLSNLHPPIFKNPSSPLFSLSLMPRYADLMGDLHDCAKPTFLTTGRD